MTVSIWRYSHLALALASFVFVCVASITGIILAFEPISEQFHGYKIKDADQQSLSKTIAIVQEKYDEVLELKVDNNQYVIASVITKEGSSGTFYINPKTGEKIGDLIQKAPIFKFTTNLHRSLFLKSTGRFLVGLFSFLLCLIAISGSILVIKRQGGILKSFSKVVKDNVYQYYHVIFGRLSIIPILIITITGVYLSLEKFSLIPTEQEAHEVNYETIKATPKIALNEMSIFNTLRLDEVRKVIFPFSDDVEDYFQIELKTKEIIVNQFTGEILSEIEYPFTKIASYYSLILHTGQGSILWSVILLIATAAILFFVYSGFSITKQRRKAPIKNLHDKDACEYVILVGSENGSTLTFANALQQSLEKLKKKVFLSELNAFSSYQKLKHLVVITSTYGDGEAPTNAAKFERKIKETVIKQPFTYSVVGFGSTDYPNFCKYAYDVDSWIGMQENAKQVTEVSTVNERSFEAFKKWSLNWQKSLNIFLELSKNSISQQKNQSFYTKEITELAKRIDDTFLIKLKPKKRLKFESGDLLAIKPKDDEHERLYSIGKLKNAIVLSVKKHTHGKMSGALYNLNVKDVVEARIIKNQSFHFPKKSKTVALISNGTGIGPFLGMIQHTKKTETHLFWGGRTKASYSLYEPIVTKALESGNLTSFEAAYSRETNEKVYVQDIIKKQEVFFAELLQKEAVIMICGSIAMHKEVIKVLEFCAEKYNQQSLEYYQDKGQILSDCY